MNYFDPDGRLGSPNSPSTMGPYVLPYLMNPDFALRYEYPGNVSAALQQGYPGRGGLSLSEVVFNDTLRLGKKRHSMRRHLVSAVEVGILRA